MATVGDPLLDLGWVVMGWPDDPSEAGSMATSTTTGMPRRRRDRRPRTPRQSGRGVDDIDYYVILARFKMAIVLEGGYAR